MSGFTDRFKLFGLLALCGACMATALAEEAANRITEISIDASGQLVFTVEGEGVDPIVRLEPAPNQQYRIVIQGQGAVLAPALLQDATTLSARIHQQIPAVDKAQLATNNQEAEQFQLVLTSWQKLQPHIKSNTGSRIVISLVGDHAMPPAIVAQQKREAELKRQADLKRQAEAEAALKAEEQRKAQAALQQKQAEEAALKRKQAEAEMARKREAEAQRVAAQKQKLEAEKLAAQKRLAEAKQAQARKVAASKPLQTVSSEQLQSDWVTAYRPQSQPFPDEPLAQLQLAQNIAKPFTPQMLAQDKIRPSDLRLPDLGPAEPTEPIRLNAPPANLLPDQGNFDWPMGGAMNLPIPAQPSNDSLYAMMGNPNTNVALRQAWQEVQSGNATAAEMGLRNYLEKTPDDPAARYLLGQILLRPSTEAKAGAHNSEIQARREAARQEFLKTVNSKPYLPSYLALMELYLDDENFQDANRLWTKVLALYPDNAMVLYQKGRLQEGLNAPAAAKEAYLQALGKDLNLVEAHFHLAQVELAAGRLDAARWELAQALMLAPSDGRLWKLLGFVAEKQNEPQKAGQFYRQALHPDALINYARSLEAQNQPDKAMTIYQAVETLAGDDIDLLYNLGMIYANLRQGKQAEIVLGRFLELNQDLQDTRIGQAKATLKQLGRKNNAKPGLQPKILPY